MPPPDRVPGVRASQVRQVKRVVKLLALLSVATAATAVLLVVAGDEGAHIRILIAAALGVGLAVFLGTALMSLVFLSSSSGRDAQAADLQERVDP